MTRLPMIRPRPGLLTPLLLLAVMAVMAPSAAGRDPTEPPPEARAAERSAARDAPAADPVLRHLVRIDGQRYVLDGARRLGIGDQLGTLRIECIHDDGITVRDESGQRRRLPLFGAVQIRPAGTTTRPADTCPEAPSSKRSPR